MVPPRFVGPLFAQLHGALTAGTPVPPRLLDQLCYPSQHLELDDDVWKRIDG